MPTKVYKEDTPLNTITKIRNILSNIGTINYESSWANPYNGVYSVHIESMFEDGCFGTNGKGRSMLFALASAYAEHIERLQNGFLMGSNSSNRLLLNKIKQETGFYYFPDERFLSEDDFRHLPQEYLDDIFGDCIEKVDSDIKIFFERLHANGYPGVLAVPFYNVASDMVTYLPLNLTLSMTGSNGMSAGNTMSEGVYQALCEILERYAAATIYYRQLTPPTISDSFLMNYPKEYDIIKEIEKNGYHVVVKDFSCGMQIPVLGILIINKETNRYRLNVGSDVSFNIALSRVITEVYQGVNNNDFFDDILLPIPTEEYDYFLHSDENSLRKRANELRKFTINNLGLFPYSFFKESSSYEFDPLVFTPNKTYFDDIMSLISKVKKYGLDIYMRDVSFLGFPSYYIYIPSISPLGCKSTNYEKERMNIPSYICNDIIEDIFFPFNDLINSDEKLKDAESIFSHFVNKHGAISENKMCELLRLEFEANSDWAIIPVSFFMTLFNYLLKDYTSAILYLKIFIEISENEADAYYKNVLLYFEALQNNKSNDDIENEIPLDILEDFKDVNKLFSHIGIPICPSCSSCKLSDICLTKGKIDYSIRIIKKMKETAISQDVFKIYK